MKIGLLCTFASQGTLSLLNLFISILLLREQGVEQFGVYSLAFFLGLTCISFQNAVVNSPLSTELNRVRPSSLGRLLGFYNVTNLFYCLIVVAVGWGAALIIGITPAVLVLYLLALLMREFWKGVLYCLNDAVLVMWLDLLFAALTAIALVLITPESVDQALLLIGSMMWSFVLVLLFRPVLHRFSGLGTSWRFFLRHVWHKARWTLVGVLTTELHSRSYLFLSGSFFGTAAVGSLQSARIPFGPLSLMITAWSRFSRPLLSRWKRESQESRRLDYLWMSMAVFAVMNVGFFGVLWLLWDYVLAFVFKGLEDSVFDIVILWFVLTLFLHLRTLVSVYHQSNNEFRFVSMTGIQGLIVTLLFSGVIIVLGDYRWMPMALVLGEILMLGLLIWPITKRRV